MSKNISKSKSKIFENVSEETYYVFVDDAVNFINFEKVFEIIRSCPITPRNSIGKNPSI
jgi:hypothetical protein